jgi:hypothetical protein
MGILALLRRAGDTSPVAFIAMYAGCVLAVVVGMCLYPDNMAVSVILSSLWLVANLLLWIVVIWFRDDDWMMGAVLIVLATFVTNMVGQLFVAAIVNRSVSVVVGLVMTATFVLLIRLIVGIPIAGGIILVARWLTNKIRGPQSTRRRPAI